MAEFQWWLVIVGLVVGGTVVGLLGARFARSDGDLAADEREAEATFIASNLGVPGERVDRSVVAAVLEAHREYLEYPAPDAIVSTAVTAREGPSAADGWSAGDRHPDREADDIRDAGRGSADRDLPGA